MKNNPFAIIKSANKWQGKIDGPGRFESFESQEMGVRAGFINLFNLNKRINGSLKDLVYAYAPPFENDSALYSKQAAQWSGIPEGAKPNLQDEQAHLSLGLAIIRKEGIKPAPTDEQIARGFLLARNQLGLKAEQAPPLDNEQKPTGGDIVSEAMIFFLMAAAVFLIVKFFTK
jgi:hypothetical protein